MTILNQYRNLILILVVIFISNYSYAGDITISQVASLKNDGTGKIDLSYSVKNSLLNNFSFGNYVFGPKANETRFASENSKVEKSNFYMRSDDKSIAVTNIVLDYKDLNKINQAAGFADIKASWKKTDGGNEFRWVVTANPKAVAQISQYTYKFTFDDKVLSSNGSLVEGNTVTWYKDKDIDPTKDIVLTAIIKSDGSSPTTNEGDKKSCGLFGIELPLLMIAGLVFSNKFNRKRSKNQ